MFDLDTFLIGYDDDMSIKSKSVCCLIDDDRLQKTVFQYIKKFGYLQSAKNAKEIMDYFKLQSSLKTKEIAAVYCPRYGRKFVKFAVDNFLVELADEVLGMYGLDYESDIKNWEDGDLLEQCCLEFNYWIDFVNSVLSPDETSRKALREIKEIIAEKKNEEYKQNLKKTDVDRCKQIH